MVQIEEPDNDYHVIATDLCPRNDEVGEAVLLFVAEWLMGAGREGHDPPLQREAENLQKPVDNSKIHVKIFKILQRNTKKKQRIPPMSERGQ